MWSARAWPVSDSRKLWEQLALMAQNPHPSEPSAVGSAQGVVCGPWPQFGGDCPQTHCAHSRLSPTPCTYPPPPPLQGSPVGRWSQGGASEQAGQRKGGGEGVCAWRWGLAGWFPGAEALPANSGRRGVQPGFAAWAQRQSQAHTPAQSSSACLQAWGRTVLTLWGERWL